MNLREVTMVLTWAAVQAADMLTAPVEKFSMAGENETPHDHAIIVDGLALDILNNLVFAAMGGAGIEQGLEQCLLGV